MPPGNTSGKNARISKPLRSSIGNPRVTDHAVKRAKQFFGVPKSQAHRWVIKKLKQGELTGRIRNTRFYKSGGVFIILERNTVVTVVPKQRTFMGETQKDLLELLRGKPMRLPSINRYMSTRGYAPAEIKLAVDELMAEGKITEEDGLFHGRKEEESQGK